MVLCCFPMVPCGFPMALCHGAAIRRSPAQLCGFPMALPSQRLLRSGILFRAAVSGAAAVSPAQRQVLPRSAVGKHHLPSCSCALVRQQPHPQHLIPTPRPGDSLITHRIPASRPGGSHIRPRCARLLAKPEYFSPPDEVCCWQGGAVAQTLTPDETCCWQGPLLQIYYWQSALKPRFCAREEPKPGKYRRF